LPLVPAFRHCLYVLCLWLTLGTVSAHALLPFASPAAARGSAFSAATSDVSLGPARRGEPGKGKKQGGVLSPELVSGGDLGGDSPAGLPPVPPALPACADPHLQVALPALDAVPPVHSRRGHRPRAPPSA
jgi:hypothetical protein